MKDLFMFFILDLLFSVLRSTEIWMALCMTLAEKLNPILNSLRRTLRFKIMEILRVSSDV